MKFFLKMQWQFTYGLAEYDICFAWQGFGWFSCDGILKNWISIIGAVLKVDEIFVS